MGEADDQLNRLATKDGRALSSYGVLVRKSDDISPFCDSAQQSLECPEVIFLHFILPSLVLRSLENYVMPLS